VEDHLANCVDCRATLEEYRAMRQQLTSLRVVPALSDIREATMSKINTESNKNFFKGLLRPALAAIPVVAILIALSILQPWNSFPAPQSILTRVYAATSELQSYGLVIYSEATSDEGPVVSTMELNYSEPDRYYRKSLAGENTQEIIIIGDRQYINYHDSSRYMTRSAIESTIAGITSMYTKETALKMLDSLTDLERLPDEIIDGMDCLHYMGRIDMERQVAENIRSMQDNRDQFGLPPLTDEDLARFEEEMSYLRDIKINVELWIGEDDYLIRQFKTDQQLPDYLGTVHRTSMTMRYTSFNEPVSIQPPLDDQGSLLPGWNLAGSITSDSSQYVFTSDMLMSIGAQTGYNDPAHQRINFEISLTNQSAEKVNDGSVLVTTMVTDVAQKPQVFKAEPEDSGIHDFEPDQSRVYKLSLDFDGSNLSKQEISRLADETVIVVHFTTGDGNELFHQLYPHPSSDTRRERTPLE
jgi:hypothetical protein